MLGDLVNKGPKSVEAVRFARSINALGLMGNHEEVVFKVLKGIRQKAGVFQWTDDLSAEDVAYLQSWPYTIRLPWLNPPLTLVHAGLVPGVPMEQQKLHDICHMRDVLQHDDGSFEAFESKAPDGAKAWASQWPGPDHVVFGHDAKRKLQLERHATGLDTGCLYGHKLTALVFPGEAIRPCPPHITHISLTTHSHEMLAKPNFFHFPLSLLAACLCMCAYGCLHGYLTARV